MKLATPKPRSGRRKLPPGRGKPYHLGTNVSEEMRDRFVSWCEQRQLEQSEALRMAIEALLSQPEMKGGTI